ncbi:GlxA family transcriptional regulator [Kosakonia sp. BK9b]
MTCNMQNQTLFQLREFTMKIGLLALPGSMRSALSGLADMFWLANQVIVQNPTLNPALQRDSPFFDVSVITRDGKPVADVQGREIASDGAFDSVPRFNLIIASGMQLDEQKYPLEREAVTAAAAWLKQQYQQGSGVAGACAGSFVLAEAGLLDERDCATTWWLYHTFRDRFTKARPQWGRVLVEQDNVVTTGGPLSWVDLVIHLVRQHAGSELARLTADMAVADSQPLSQQLYAPGGFLNARHPLLMQAEHLVRYQHPDITVEQLAAALNMTTRTLNRKMAALIQESPKAFITRVRIENAAMLLSMPAKSVLQVALACGYKDETAFRRAFSALMGMSPGSYRQWVKTRMGDVSPT